MKISVFKTETGRDQFRAYYNQVLSQFPFGQQSIKTTFGQTFILTAGQESHQPIILLHGSCSNSLSHQQKSIYSQTAVMW